jgi:broad specificity phosphatase PhoE
MYWSTIHVARRVFGSLPLSLLVGKKCWSSCSASARNSNEQQGTTVYFVRHGEAEHNILEEGESSFMVRRDLKLADPFLTNKGIAQGKAAAVTLAEKLRDNHDEKPAIVVSSTLRRALQTAELAALPIAKSEANLLALDLACEIQFGDIWNEPRDEASVNADWPRWTIEHCNPWLDCGNPPFETADNMVSRAEQIWCRLSALQSPVIVFVAHGCILHFLMWRLSAVLDDLDLAYFGNAEVRRIHLPPPDGRSLSFQELVIELERVNKELPDREVKFWNRFSKRAKAIIAAGSSEAPFWTQREWRYDQEDSDFDSKL